MDSKLVANVYLLFTDIVDRLLISNRVGIPLESNVILVEDSENIVVKLRVNGIEQHVRLRFSSPILNVGKVVMSVLRPLVQKYLTKYFIEPVDIDLGSTSITVASDRGYVVCRSTKPTLVQLYEGGKVLLPYEVLCLGEVLRMFS